MTSTRRSYFHEIYQDDADPWGFETREYEQRKYELTMASLPNRRYDSAYEPGCSIGVLSSLLAQRCDRLLATDIVPGVVSHAAARLAAHPHVTVEECGIPEGWPQGVFDLIVLSEIAYYFDESALSELTELVLASTRAGSHILGVHWRGETDYPLTGDRTHELIDASPHLRRIVHHTETEFLLDVWERTQ